MDGMRTEKGFVFGVWCFELRVAGYAEFQMMERSDTRTLEAVSKNGFWFKIEAEPSFNPQAYLSMSRT
jgi:hypothetical protein